MTSRPQHPNTSAVLAGVALTVVGLVLWFRFSSAHLPVRKMHAHYADNKEFWKLDAAGNFVESFGMSFVGFLEDRTSAVWGSVLQRLSRVGEGTYRPVTADSLHVTVKNNSTAAGLGLSSTLYLAQLLKSVHFVNAARETCSRFAFKARARVSSIEVGDTIRACLTMENDPEPLRGALTQLGSRSEPNFKFHVTLAYRFVKPNDGEGKKIAIVVREIEQELIGLGVLQFDQTALYLHHDMLRFQLIE